MNNLERELSSIKGLQKKDIQAVTAFLVERELSSLGHVDLKTLTDYYSYVVKAFFQKAKQNHYGALLEIAVREYLRTLFDELIIEIDFCGKVTREKGNKVKTFLMLQGISSLNEITYDSRQKYEAYLRATDCCKVQEYVKTLDQLKLHAIQKNNESNPGRVFQISYEPQVIYLGYHPDYQTAMDFYYVRDKFELVFDFSIEAPEKLKRQIFSMLVYSLERPINRKNRRELYLVPLKKLYLYCAECDIEDIEQMQEREIAGFRRSMDGKVGTKTDIYMQIVNTTRKHLFMTAEDIHWDAHVWYMDRFRLKENQMNPANHVECLRFLKIYDEDNLADFKNYMKYLIGVRKIGMTSVQARYYCILQFLLYCEEKGVSADKIGSVHIEQYLKMLYDRENNQGTFNQAVKTLYAFFEYLVTKGRLQVVPFRREFFEMRTIHKHHFGYVDETTQNKFLRKLGKFPEDLRLMCIHVWATGIRCNEVCTIKGGAYEYDGEDAWMTVKQFKTGSVKTIPIPYNLYKLMKEYISRNAIGPEEYVFKSRKGRAYDASTFRIQVQRLCRENGMDYIFRPHDYRHVVATDLYTEGVPLDQIADYMGHRKRDITGNYIDIAQEHIDKENRKYFADNSWDLEMPTRDAKMIREENR